MQIRWVRVGAIAVALEVVLFAVLVPISFMNQTVFLVAVPVGVFVFAFLLTRWFLRPVTRHVLLHGTLIGVVATALYLALVAAQPGGLGAALAVYGAPLFWFSQALRVIGCLAGAAARQHRQQLVVPGAG